MSSTIKSSFRKDNLVATESKLLFDGESSHASTVQTPKNYNANIPMQSTAARTEPNTLPESDDCATVSNNTKRHIGFVPVQSLSGENRPPSASSVRSLSGSSSSSAFSDARKLTDIPARRSSANNSAKLLYELPGSSSPVSASPTGRNARETSAFKATTSAIPVPQYNPNRQSSSQSNYSPSSQSRTNLKSNLKTKFQPSLNSSLESDSAGTDYMSVSTKPLAISVNHQSMKSPMMGDSKFSRNEMMSPSFNSVDEVKRTMELLMNDQDLEDREEEFEQILLQLKNWEIKKVKSDGSCLFRAIAHQLYSDESLHSIIRQDCCDYLTKHSTYFSAFVTDPIDKYIQRKRQPNEFGNHVEIVALAACYKRTIEVYEYSFEPIFVIDGAKHELNNQDSNVNENVQDSERLSDEEPIRLSYHASSHYNSLIASSTFMMTDDEGSGNFGEHDDTPFYSDVHNSADDVYSMSLDD
ncbi:hypothetical protein BKA69DRAFT_1068886 [Paraphysoderma sedebokerense]|nr:hypothetical protein BKA69DRAFT_1068886 [Paraphysoderma sedebokerense]